MSLEKCQIIELPKIARSARQFTFIEADKYVRFSLQRVWRSCIFMDKQTGMTDLNSAQSINLDVVFVEAHAINAKGEIIATGRVMHELDANGQTVATDAQQCAPAPPSTFLLTPVAPVVE